MGDTGSEARPPRSAVVPVQGGDRWDTRPHPRQRAVGHGCRDAFVSVCVSSDVDALEQCELIRAGFDLSAAGGVQPSRPQQQGGKGDRGDGGCLFFSFFSSFRRGPGMEGELWNRARTRSQSSTEASKDRAQCCAHA